MIVAIETMMRSNIASLLLHKHKQHVLPQAHLIETSAPVLLKNKRIKQSLLVEMLNIQEEATKLELYLMCDRAHVTLSHMTRVLTPPLTRSTLKIVEDRLIFTYKIRGFFCTNSAL